MFLSHLRSRRSFLFSKLPKVSIGAEIGVWRGDFSMEILSRARPRELHLIDPWQFAPSLPGRLYGGREAKSQSDMDQIYQSVVDRFERRRQVRIHRASSRDAAASFPNGFFDWVYIDGDHSYEAVWQDLNDWSSKVKSGGLVIGDDYTWRDEFGAESVRKAVGEFMNFRSINRVLIKHDQFVLTV